MKAFTLIEVMVVVVIIGILASISILGYNSVQKNARDSSRSAKATVISEALEKYYEKNNEYPSVAALGSQSITAVKQKLSIQDSDVLVLPSGTPGVSAIYSSGPSPTRLAYTGTPNDATCQSNASGYCDTFQLQYVAEADNSTVTINSRQTVTAAPECTSNCLSAPTRPSVVGSAVGTSNVRFTASAATCAVGSVQYKIRYNTSSPGAMPAWSDASVPDWSSSTTRDIGYPMNATTYYSQSLARCVDGATTSPASAESAVHTFDTTGVPIPAAPTGLSTTVVIDSGSNAVGTFGGGSCDPGATLQRQTQYLTDYYLYGGTWSGLVDYASTTQTRPVNEGWQMSFHQQARCVDSTTGAASAWTWGPQAGATRPISTLGAPSVSASGTPSRTTYNWSGAACPIGTSKEYQYYLSGNWGGTSGWWGPTTGTSYSWADSSQGYTFTLQAQQRCTNSYYTGAWSASGSAAYARPVDTPGKPTGFSKDLNGNAGIAFSWTSPTCGQATGGQYRLDWTNGGGTGILWVNPESGRSNGWWYGNPGTDLLSSDPGNGNEAGANANWIDAWGSSYGYMGHKTNIYAVTPPKMDLDVGVAGVFDSGNILGISVEYRCRNSVTGVASGVSERNGMVYTWP